MKILVDECCPPAVADALQQDRHDVVYVAAGMSGLSDADILSQSVADKRIIVTEDRDFCELVFRDARPAYGIVLVRIPHTRRAEKASRVRELFAARQAELPHAMITLTLTNVRMRPLPASPDDEAGESSGS